MFQDESETRARKGANKRIGDGTGYLNLETYDVGV
jgi:hypothetical protein